MRIHNTFIGQIAEPSTELQTARGAPPQRETAATQADQPGEHVPAPEVQHLAALAAQEPEVRENKVNEAAQRLANGDYLTPDAALRTADALLAAPE